LKIVNFLLLILFGGILVFAAFSLPPRAYPNDPLNSSQSQAHTPGASNYYIENAKSVADTDNMVTVILADWRGFDTLGEETVIFTAALVCLLLLRKWGTQDAE
jgi:multicomponent Na+:H+ antiporter subunit B